MTKRIKEWFKKIDWISTKVSAVEAKDVKDDFDKQVEAMYKEPDTDDGLPF